MLCLDTPYLWSGLEILAASLCLSDLESPARVGCFVCTDTISNSSFLIVRDCREGSFPVTEKALVIQSRVLYGINSGSMSLGEIMFPDNFASDFICDCSPSLMNGRVDFYSPSYFLLS